MRSLMRLFWRIASAEKVAFTRAFVLAALVLFMGSALLGLSGWFITASAGAGLLGAGAVFDVFRPSAMIRFLALGRTFARYGERLLTHDATLRALEHLRLRTLLSHLQLSYQQLLALRGSQALNRLTTDIDALDGVTLRLVQPLVAALLVQIVGLITLSWLASPSVATWVFLTYVVGTMLIFVFGVHLAVWSSFRAGSAVRSFRSGLIDMIHSRRDLAVYGQLRAQADAVALREQRRARLRISFDRVDRLAGAAFGTLASVAAGGALVLGSGAVPYRVTVAQLALSIFVALALSESLIPLRRAIADLGRMIEAARRVEPLLAREYRMPGSSTGPVSIDAEKSLGVVSLRLRRIDGAPLHLPALTFAIAPGQTLAVTGASGSGKSTLLLTLAGLQDPVGGEIKIGQTLLQALDEETLRRLVTLVPQRSVLMGGSVAEELRIAAPGCSEQEMWQALEAAQIATLIRSRDGLETTTGPGGDAFSGGERRRIILARALLRRPAILLLDEPTEGIDEKTAQSVLIGLREFLPASVFVIAAHKPVETAFASRTLAL